MLRVLSARRLEGLSMDSSPRFVDGRTLGKRLCEVLDIDSSRCSAIIIKAAVNGAASVEVHYRFRFDDITSLADTMKQYRKVDQEEWQHYHLAEDQ